MEKGRGAGGIGLLPCVGDGGRLPCMAAPSAGAEEGRCAGEKKGKKGRDADTRGQCAVREESVQRWLAS